MQEPKTAESPKPEKNPWLISDALWDAVKEWLPGRPVKKTGKRRKRAKGGGREALDKRAVLSAVFYVAREGIAWKALPMEDYGSPSAIHEYYRLWLAGGVFDKFWRKGLALSKELEGIAWCWVSDGDKVSWRPAFRSRKSSGKPVEDARKKHRHPRFQATKPATSAG